MGSVVSGDNDEILHKVSEVVSDWTVGIPRLVHITFTQLFLTVVEHGCAAMQSDESLQTLISTTIRKVIASDGTANQGVIVKGSQEEDAVAALALLCLFSSFSHLCAIRSHFPNKQAS